MNPSLRSWLLLLMSIPLTGCCCGAYTAGCGYGYGYGNVCADPCVPPVNPCPPPVNPCPPPVNPCPPANYCDPCGPRHGHGGGCGLVYNCNTGCCILDSICCTLRAIDQWKCDNWGCCLFGVRPSPYSPYAYQYGYAAGLGVNDCCGPVGMPAPISPGCCEPGGGYVSPGLGYPASPSPGYPVSPGQYPASPGTFPTPTTPSGVYYTPTPGTPQLMTPMQ